MRQPKGGRWPSDYRPPMAHNAGLIPETGSRIDLYLMP